MSLTIDQIRNIENNSYNIGIKAAIDLTVAKADAAYELYKKFDGPNGYYIQYTNYKDLASSLEGLLR